MFLTDVNNCSSYYICVNNEPILQTCENNLYFDASGQSCVASNSQCLNCIPNQLAVYPLQKTCNKYILCFDGTPVIQQCADNLQYNPNTQQCDFPQNVNCIENQCSIYQDDPTNIVYIPSYDNCSTFSVCMRGETYIHNCATGLNFSTACNCCTENSSCSIPSTGTTGGKKSLRSINRFNLSPFNKPVQVNIQCPEEGIKFLPHEERENQFYMCLNGKGALMTCAPNLYYDNSIHSCRSLEQIASF